MIDLTPGGFRQEIQQFLQGECPSCSVEAALSTTARLVDVRTAEEFGQGSLPGATNFPLFDHLERAEIGTLYKQIGPDAAIERGKDLFSHKVQEFLKPFEETQDSELVVYCARGGMRSASVVRLLRTCGYRAVQMQGGYKEYRRYVLSALENFRGHFVVLHGQTGVGKTRILQKLPDALDLEDLAQHRSSLFGALHRTPRTQRNFEGLLLARTQELPHGVPWFVEGESQKVGPVFIPKALFQAMQQGTTILLEASLETRVQRTVEDYPIRNEQDLQEVDKILQTLKVALGAKVVEHLRICLRQNRLEEVARVLLTDYYDLRYRHTMRHYDYSLRLCAENLDATVNELVNHRRALMSSGAPS